MSCLVYFKLQRSPTPYGPPIQPVFTRYAPAPTSSSLAASISYVCSRCFGTRLARGHVEHGDATDDSIREDNMLAEHLETATDTCGVGSHTLLEALTTVGRAENTAEL